MDNLTHTLFALTLSNAGLRRAGRGSTAALLIASNIPDLEIVTVFGGGRVAYLASHRGPTHGPAGLLLGLATGAAVWTFLRLRGRREDDAGFAALVGLACIGVLGHIAMDFATSYGTRVLSPFSYVWFGVDWMPIIDVFLWAVLSLGLVVTRLRPAARARIAAVVLVLLGADYALRAWMHARAVESAFALDVPAADPAIAAPTTIFRYLDHSVPAALPAALPTEGSPFEWRLVVRMRGGYLVTDVNLLDRRPGWQDRARHRGVWFPNDAGPLVERAASTRLGRVFLAFSRFPSAEIVKHSNGDLTVHWYDVRFAEGRAPIGGDRRQHTSPFAVWVRLSPGGNVVGEGLGPG